VRFGLNVNLKVKKYPLVSVIIPCFNSGKVIRRALDSVINQTWPAIEIVLVNDGSYDRETLQIIKFYSNQNKILLINQNNLGLPAARNNGVRNSYGEYLYFLDSDDWIEPQSIELLLKFLTEKKGVGFVFSDLILEGETQKIVQKEYNFFEQLFINQIPYSILISKKNWLLNKGYDEKMINGYEDWDFNIRLGASAIHGKRLPKALFHYNVSSTGMLLSKSSKLHAKIWDYIITKNSELYKLKKMFVLWHLWRIKSSTYPLIVFFIWYFLFRVFPKPIFSRLFIKIRNIKWSFTRKKI